ncbi:HEPN domain-containing protein [Mucilaginibacter sp. McL0603]|uniref:HEPN domain-containing protein n=1 Tax=Mucilaginibacter sp. McL0603 TaxID=3415670 RepID=UPI003CE7F0F4
MQATEYTKWDFLPISLTVGEAHQPLIVLDDFFSDDWLPGHLERLQKWRNYILKNDYYKDHKNSPAELLYFYQLNLRLIDAVFLLNEKQDSCNQIKVIPDLNEERLPWRDYPANLNESELFNPYLVTKRFFKDYNLPQYREMLFDWLEYGLSASAANEFIETRDLIKVYENLQKLYSAAWMIYQRESGKPYLKIDFNQLAMKNDSLTSATTETQPSLYQLNTSISPDRELILRKVVSVIKHKLTTVQSILYLGAIPGEPDRIFLLILTSGDELNQASSLGSMIEESVQPVADVTALVHYASALFKGASDDNLFFGKALHCPIIYLSGDLLLPVPKPPCLSASKDASFNWERWQEQGREFLLGAEFYLENNAHKAALFSLHQCAECLLIAVIRAVLDYRINNHNLSKLLQITQMFTTDLIDLFGLDVPENKEMFDLLKHAYVNVRYRDIFEPDTKSVAALYLVTKDLVMLTNKVYEKHLMITTV